MTGPHDTDDLVARLRRGPERPGAARPPATAGNGQAPDPDGLAALVDAALARADRDDLVDVGWVVTDSPVGPLTLAATPEGVVRVGFGTQEDVLEHLAGEVSPRVVRLPSRLDGLRRQLDEYFAGRRRSFDVPLDRRLSHGYRRQVLEALSQVPYGETVSYKDLAVRTGNPGASRAVGTAMATNPIPIVVPCHRVLRTGGALGGYGGGIDTKVWLLRLEGALAL
ncbi:MAG TPA: methylated-DNA--[protein]-cysteine S-methyltransferase [Acidimicrobiales bacterium]|nr:methylated-DNA--[protein]-cysteine S-methyltransferase [Acidimicrobiales bacterium]